MTIETTMDRSATPPMNQGNTAAGETGFQTVRTPDDTGHPARLKAKDVSVFYSEKQALFDVSIDIPERPSAPLSAPRVAANPPSCAASIA